VENILIGLVMMAAGILCLLLYFLPAIISFKREHEYRWAIFAINLFVGWSFIGWVVALVWAVMPKGKLS